MVKIKSHIIVLLISVFQIFGTSNAQFSAYPVSVSDVKCHGSADGSFSVSATGGSTPYEFALIGNGFNDSGIFHNLTEGIYQVVARDGNASTDTINIRIKQPDNLQYSDTSLAPICPNDRSGFVSLKNLTGGTGTYTYRWFDGDRTYASTGLTNVPSAIYTLEIQDANHCTWFDTFDLSAQNDIQVSYNKENISCYDKQDGAISLQVTKSTNTSSASWVGPNGFSSTSKSLTNLEQGFYYYVVTDDTTGCADSSTIFIQRPPEINLSIKNKRDVLCFGDSSGLIVPQITGGTKPYIYDWSGPNGYSSRNPTVNDGIKGEYRLILTDIEGCADTVEVTLNEPNKLLVADDSRGVSCFGKSNGYVKLTVNGGLKPYAYQWSNGATSSDINNVIAGNYEVIITDSNNCIYKNTFDVSSPQNLELDYTKSDISCHGKTDGRYTLITTGGSFPFTYDITTPSGSTISTINNKNVSAGNYSVLITDANGCKDSTVIPINEPDPLVLITTVTNPSCHGLQGALSTSVSGGTQPYNFQWLDSSGALYAATQNVVSVDTGIYFLTVTDANRCQVFDTTDIIEPSEVELKLIKTQNPACLADSIGEIEVTASGGTSPYFYYLNKSNGTNTGKFDSLAVGRYIVTVQDKNKCESNLNIQIKNLDTIDPIPNLLDRTIYLDKNGKATLDVGDIDDGSSDNCSLSSISLSKTTFNCSDTGTQQITVTITDLSGNAVSDIVSITVRDTIKPTLNLRNYSVYLDSLGKASVSPSDLDKGTFDNCGLKKLIISKENFDCNSLGVNTVVFEALDFSGNKSLDSVYINVIDTLKPKIKIKNITAYLNSSGTLSVNPSDVDNGSKDNCGIVSSTLAQRLFDCLNLGNNFVNYTIQDASGNSASTLVQIRILDTISPQVRTKPVTVYLNSFGFGVVNPSNVDSGSFDNCNISSIVLGQSVFTCTDLGVNSTNLTVVDASGNYSSAAAKVTVIDTIYPKVVTRNPTIYLDFNGTGFLSVFDVDKGSSDNCGLSKISISKDLFDCSDLGVQKIDFVVTDASGNSSLGAVNVTVKDTIEPTVLYKNKDVFLGENGEFVVTPSYFDLGTNDNCSIQSQKLSKDTLGESDLGNIVVLYSATDSSGNRGLEVLNFKVRDSIAPVIRVDKQTRYLDAQGQSKLEVSEIMGGVSDNLTIESVSLSDSTFACDQLGKSEVNLTVRDVAGNATTVPIILEVLDTIKPVIKLKPAILEIDTAGRAFLNVSSVIDTIIENCIITDIRLSRIQFDFNSQGENFVQVYVTDQSGNVSEIGDAKVTVVLGDADKDSIPDYVESAKDFDGDGVPNYLDKDSDNDGILDVDENSGLATLLDLDGDGFFNIYDLDADGDKIFDVLEVDGYDVEPFDGTVGIGKVTVNTFNGVPVLADGGEGFIPLDTDADNIDDYKDRDSDDDGIDDIHERGDKLQPRDNDNDNTPDYRDTDSDNDNISDLIETDYDTDLDDIPNYIDEDSDEDGISDLIETNTDFDLDGFGNWIDLDSDNDGIDDFQEGSLDYDMDGIGNWLDIDSDGDLIPDSVEGLTMTDLDLVPDFLDIDSDNDFINDSIEAVPMVNGIPADTDNDGVYDFRDIDSDDDGLSDDYEGNGDVDSDGIGNYRDTDSDNDNISDLIEGAGDLDGDGLPNNIDPDSDGDGIPDLIETYADFDGDNVPNCLDLDSDNDGLNDLIECGYYDTFGIGLIHPNDQLDLADIERDVDGDGFYNFVDLDSDGDGISDLDEAWYYAYDRNYDGIIDGPDSDGDGILDNVDNYGGVFGDYYDYPAPDSDYDEIPDFEDFDSDGDGILDEVETINDQDFDFISNYLDEDSDSDKLLDVDETDDDYDLDGLPNFIDTDSDGDGIHDSTELDGDFDGDGDLNYLDTDSDNDGVSDKIEGEKDTDNNGIPDYIDPQIFVPEVFTPNGDGVNEKLILTGLQNYPDARIQIFNQWGQIVFDSNGPYKNDWHGIANSTGDQTNGLVLSEGVYFYIVHYNRDDLPQFKKAPQKGNIYIKP